MKVKFFKSTNPKKKLMAIFFNDKNKKIKTTHFGSAGMNDYTLTGDKEARTRYRKRHQKDLKTNDFKRAGYLSYYILWGDSKDIIKNMDDYKKRFNLK
jgi:hypothetical protein